MLISRSASATRVSSSSLNTLASRVDIDPRRTGVSSPRLVRSPDSSPVTSPPSPPLRRRHSPYGSVALDDPTSEEEDTPQPTPVRPPGVYRIIQGLRKVPHTPPSISHPLTTNAKSVLRFDKVVHVAAGFKRSPRAPKPPKNPAKENPQHKHYTAKKHDHGAREPVNTASGSGPSRSLYLLSRPSGDQSESNASSANSSVASLVSFDHPLNLHDYVPGSAPQAFLPSDDPFLRDMWLDEEPAQRQQPSRPERFSEDLEEDVQAMKVDKGKKVAYGEKMQNRKKVAQGGVFTALAELESDPGSEVDGDIEEGDDTSDEEDRQQAADIDTAEEEDDLIEFCEAHGYPRNDIESSDEDDGSDSDDESPENRLPCRIQDDTDVRHIKGKGKGKAMVVRRKLQSDVSLAKIQRAELRAREDAVLLSYHVRDWQNKSAAEIYAAERREESVARYANSDLPEVPLILAETIFSPRRIAKPDTKGTEKAKGEEKYLQMPVRLGTTVQMREMSPVHEHRDRGRKRNRLDDSPTAVSERSGRSQRRGEGKRRT